MQSEESIAIVHLVVGILSVLQNAIDASVIRK